MKGITVTRFIYLITVLSIITILVVNYYGGYFRDAVVKTTCPMVGEEYESGEKVGEGKCIIPVGAFD